MLKKLSVLLMALTFLPAILFAQDKMVMRPDGKFYKMKGNETSLEIMKMKPFDKKSEAITLNKVPGSTLGLLDTLGYNDGSFNTNFGLFGQDWMVQWFKAPADMTIKGVAFLSTDDAGVANGAILEVKLVKVSLSEAELLAVPVEWDGYYTASGNGYNNVTSFKGNPDYLGEGWVSITGDPEPFGDDLWSDGGFGAPITPLPAGGTTYQWVDMNILFEPTVLGGEIFGVAYKNTGTTLDADRLGFMSGIIGYPGWKFYANGRLDPGNDYGWWSREYTWDYLVAVDITGDPPPDINSFTVIQSGVDVGPFTIDADITDTNPGDPGSAGVAGAKIMWSNDGQTTWNEVAMTGSEPSYTGQIPAQTPGTTVDYYIEATDVNNHSSVSATVSFFVFAPSLARTLVVFNGFSAVTGYPQSYYFGPDITGGGFYFEHDTWGYGLLPASIMDSYDNVIEICNGAPSDYQDAIIRPWLEANGSRNYYLVGQEWLGDRYSYADQDFTAGSFEFDILGIGHSYNDVSYDGTSGQSIPSLVTPISGTAFGGPLFDLFNSYGDADSLMYNPTFETGGSNWIDAYEVADGEVDMNVETRGIGGVPMVETHPTMHHRTLGAGNKIFYAAYDPIALNTAVDDSYSYYHWADYTNDNSPYQALLWFGIPILVSDVTPDGNNIPNEFSISQNYPNPFNPATTIKFAVPTASKVVLKVYDILGTEVATLVNSNLTSGNYEVNFDASKLASGVYVYTINAGSFTATKKMMLMK